MKVLGVTIVLFLATVVPSCALAQSKNDYLSMSKFEKKMAWIVTGAVPVAIAAGLLQKEKPTNAYFTLPKGTVTFISGGILAALSTALFISSAKNKKKAAYFSLGAASPGLLQMKVSVSL
jgi:hypothetical protein